MQDEIAAARFFIDRGMAAEASLAGNATDAKTLRPAFAIRASARLTSSIIRS